MQAETSSLESGLASHGALRWVATDVTLALEEARRRLGLSPIAAVALGRALTGAVLLQRIALKVPARLLLEVMGDGPLGKIVAEANTDGSLRGLVGTPQLETPPAGDLQIATSVGRGTLRVTREGDQRGRYSSQVELVSGELGDDLTHYLEQSEQIRSAVLLGVLPRPSGIAAAGGLLVEALPGTDEPVIDHLEGNIRRLSGVSTYLDGGGIPHLVHAVLDGFDQEVLERHPLEYRCRCSRAGLLERLLSMAADDRSDVIGPDGRCIAECAFCGASYTYRAEELTATN